MASTKTEHRFDEIGQLLADATGRPLAGVLLYARVEPNMVSQDIFIEHGDRVEYCRRGDELTYPLLDLWEQEEPGKRWAELEYVLRNGKFTVNFTYPEEVDRDEGSDAFFERRRRIVNRYFGCKPIVYPPLPADAAQQFDL